MKCRQEHVVPSCSTILDFYVSKVSDQIAVMTGKDVVILKVVKSDEEKKAEQIKKGRKKALKELSDLTFLPREQNSERDVHNEFVISQVLNMLLRTRIFRSVVCSARPPGALLLQVREEAVVEEVEGIAHLMDPDTLASARSKRKFALDTRYTPDGLKVPTTLAVLVNCSAVLRTQLVCSPKVRQMTPSGVSVTHKTFEELICCRWFSSTAGFRSLI